MIDVESFSLQEPTADVVINYVPIDEDFDSVRTEEIGFVRRIEPTV
jgi:hypothetical protein